jgi:NAD(P)-dependent dehydrogenase (short-subunit alcohol dehydrogenase family)
MKTVVVTGAYGNLGRAVVNRFLEQGFNVVGSIAPGEKAEPAIAYPNFSSKEIDLLNATDTTRWINELTEGAYVDAAVLTVGGFAMGTVEDSTPEQVQKMIRLNFETAFNTAQPLFQHMKKKGKGRLFFIGARPALNANNSKGMFAYGLSKSMIIRLAEMINLESKGTDVTATVIIPSTIDTPQNRASMPDADPSKWVKPEQIADVILFYCSKEADPVREAVVKIYGGS